MPNNFNPVNVMEVLTMAPIPTIVVWNRLEGSPRTHDFSNALKAEVRDALWMLTKQWQMGEFNADDAGSPVFAKIRITSSQLNKYKAAGNAIKDFEGHIPLETKAEQKKIPFTKAGKIISIDIRLQMGRYWLKMLKKAGLNYNSQYISMYGFELPPNTRDTDYIYANKDVWQEYAAISGRCIDGYKLYEHILQTNEASAGITSIAADITTLNNLGNSFTGWYLSMYYQPLDEKDNAWIPDRLEYQVECSASAGMEEKTLTAKEYHSGQLEWHSFDINQAPATVNSTLTKKTFINTLIPSHVKFGGMPDTRWWKFEDGKTNLGDLKPSTTDLSKLLLTEFALLFSNDWFIIPCKLPIGSLANIEGLTVKNNFGETFWIEATEAENTPGRLPWSMFKLHADKQNNTLFLAPTVTKVHESKPLEDILLIRDEMANMVWSIEKQVLSPFGTGDKGDEVALRIRQFHENYITLIRKTLSKAHFYYDDLDSTTGLNAPLNSAKSELNRIITALTQDNCDIYTLQNDLKNVKLFLGVQGHSKIYIPENYIALINKILSEARFYYDDLNSGTGLNAPLSNAKTELNRIIKALNQENCHAYTLQNDLKNVKLILSAQGHLKTYISENYVAMINEITSEANFYYDDLNSTAGLNELLSNAKIELNRIIAALKQDNCDAFTLQNDLKKVKLILGTENHLKIYIPEKKESTTKAKIRYQSMTAVPENWIPFIPVHITGDVRKTQLQRASMLRIIEGDPQKPVKIKPQTSILREGLDSTNAAQAPYYIHEQEVPRSGIRVSQSFLRTRWVNGEVFVWLGRKKKTGKGEGSSGLQFDQIVDVKE